MASPVLKPAFGPDSAQVERLARVALREADELNLPENADSSLQRQVLDALPLLVFLERNGQIVFANAAVRRLVGLGDSAWTARPVEEVLWGLYTGTAEPRTELTGSGEGKPFHATMPDGSGHMIPVEGVYSLLDSAEREAVIVAQPTERVQMPKSQMMEDVLASIPEAVALEHDDHILYTNPAFARMFGYTAEETGGESLRELIVPETRWTELATLKKTVDEQGRVTVETVRMNRDGDLIDVSLQCAPLSVEEGRIGYVYTFRDIAEHKLTEDRLQHDAMHDALTGLPNRALFMDRLNLALSRRLRRPDQNCGVLFIDMDRFKQINDALGHAAGDALLLGVAERLSDVLRPQDSAARLSGDEFAVLVENIHSPMDLEIVARRISQEMSKPFEIFGHSIRSSASIGAAMTGAAHRTARQLIRDADYAMYRAKQSGAGQYEIFDKHMEICATSLREREQEFRDALNRNEYGICYRPVYSLRSGRLECLETILAWRLQETSAEVLPELMEVAERTGHSIRIAREMMEEACRSARTLGDVYPGSTTRFSVNLRVRQFFHPEMVDWLHSALETSGANPARLVIEVSEEVLNEDPDAAVVVLQRVADCQVHIAIDNFGSGLAPLNHLVRLPVEAVKLDAKMTLGSVSSSRQQAMLEALIHLAHTQGIQVVAQGIENQEQLQMLIRLDCDGGQGSLLGAPVDGTQVLRLVVPGAD